MNKERALFLPNARKMGVLGGFALGLIALVLSVCCLGATSNVAYADSQSSVGTPASSVDASGISTAAEADQATAKFAITGINDQNEARKILALVNQARTQKAVGALTWDYDLEKAAMQRAAEIAILFSHDRPNGEKCFTAFPSGYSYYGENIHVATGESNAESANKAWTNSEDHYKNMVNSGYTCMAAAMFEADGVTYWVELFADPNSGAAEATPLNGEKTYQIEALPGNLDLCIAGGFEHNAKIGSKAPYVVMNQNTEWEFSNIEIDPTSFDWSSSNTDVVTIDANGAGTVVGNGSVTITAKNKTLATVGASVPLTINSQSSGATQAKEGWVHGSKGWWYRYSDGTYATGWLYDGKNHYFLDDQGWMKTGWQKIEGDWYYFKGSGAMTTGWQKVKNKWYFMDEDGIMLTGKITDAGKTYFLDNNGAMKTGWVQDGSNWYYTNKSGAMTTGWQKVKNKWYFMNAEGIMQTGKITDKGKTYFLADTGAMKTGWVKEGSDWYYCNNSGVMVTGWQKVKGTWYYLMPDGKMTTGWLSNNGATYYLKSSGAMAKGWQKIDNTWYYFKGSGAMTTGWQKVSGTWYYLNPADGKMLTGWQDIDGKRYYLNDSGVMQAKKWIGNYYVESNGAMATNKWIGKYHVGADGLWDDTRNTSTASTTPSATSAVYWTANGGKYHVSRNCATLKNSTKIFSGSITDAGSRERCKVCG